MKRSHLCNQPRYLGLKRGFILRLIKIGLPSSLQTLIRSAAGIAMMAIVADYGTLLLATYGVGIRIDMLVLMPGFGLAAAAATLVGQNLGAGKPERAEKSALTAVLYYVLFMLVAGVTFYIFAKPIFRVFNDTPEVLDLGKSYMRIIALSYPILGAAIILNRSLMGAGNTLPPMLITLGVLCGVTVPLALLLPRFVWLGPRGLWVAIVCGHVVACLAVATVFKRGKWKKIVL
jgi:putative MATE family efflux protein